MSDTIAIGALRELTEHGIHVPDDVRLMGFDGILLRLHQPTHQHCGDGRPAMARTVIDRMVTLNESNLRHERPDDITHDHISWRCDATHVDSGRLIPAGTLMSAGLHP